MSRFIKLNWHESVINLRPQGIRRFHPLRWFPYRTGDEPDLKLEVTGKKPQEWVKGQDLTDALLELKSVNGESIWQVHVPLFESGETHCPVRLQRINFSGEYTVFVSFGNMNKRLGFDYSFAIAQIQVKIDYYPLLVVGAIVLLILGALAPLGIDWLSNLLNIGSTSGIRDGQVVPTPII